MPAGELESLEFAVLEVSLHRVAIHLEHFCGLGRSQKFCFIAHSAILTGKER